MGTKILLIVATSAGLWGAAAASGATGEKLELMLRKRVAAQEGGHHVVREKARWDAKKTAAIVCDMWDKHWCKGATARVGEMAPRMNGLLKRLRKAGVLIVHAPSSTMGHYKDHPARKRAQQAPRAKDLPKGIAGWCKGIAAERGSAWPVDQSDGGCDCRPRCKGGSPWKKQIEAIEIRDADAISDSGVEIWNVLAERGVENVLLMGVHTNMCVIGRPFGLRNMARFGKNVALVRDLTDTMYNSRRRPFVDHFHGTDLVVEHIEKHVCPTVESCDLAGGRAFRFAADKRPRIVFAIAEREYHTWQTLPAFAHGVLAARYGCSVKVLQADPADRNRIPGFGRAVGQADLVFLSIRRRALPESDLESLRVYLRSGRPLVGIRTASHAFDTKGKHPAGHAEWRSFDPDVLGGNYHGHHGNGPVTSATVADGAAKHPILAGVKTPLTTKGSLYRTSPLTQTATPLLIGRITGKDPEPIAWTNTYRKGRIFYTALGHPDDFKGDDPPIERLLTNAVFWAVGRPAPPPAGAAPKAEK